MQFEKTLAVWFGFSLSNKLGSVGPVRKNGTEEGFSGGSW
jgi:hypothetical protein